MKRRLPPKENSFRGIILKVLIPHRKGLTQEAIAKKVREIRAISDHSLRTILSRMVTNNDIRFKQASHNCPYCSRPLDVYYWRKPK